MTWLNVKLKVLVVVSLGLVGCATSQKYDNMLNSMLGDNTDELRLAMGNPSARYISNDGKQVWAYTMVDDIYVPSEYYLYNQGGMVDDDGGIYNPFLQQYDFSPYENNFGYKVKYYCQTAFLIENDAIIGWKWAGNNCVAK